EQQVENVVVLDARGALRAHDGPEDPDPLDAPAQLVEDAESDGGLAGQPLRGGEVHTGGHGGRLSGLVSGPVSAARQVPSRSWGPRPCRGTPPIRRRTTRPVPCAAGLAPCRWRPPRTA